MKSKALPLAAFVIIITGTMYAESIINPLLMAFFISIILVQPIRWMIQKRVPEVLAVVIVIVGLLSIYLGFFKLAGASITLFIQDASKYEQSIENLTLSGQQFLEKIGMDMSMIGAANALDPSNIMQYTTLVVNELGDLLSSEFTFLLLTIFLLAEMGSIFNKIGFLTKDNPITLDYLKRIGDNIRHYLSIKTMTSLMTGALIAIGLAIIGVDFPILWGLVAFLLNYIPNIGSIIAAIPVIAFSLIQLGYGSTLWTIGLFVVINVVVGNVIEPRMMGKGLGLSTFVVFMALIFWGFILGPVGMFLSVPLTMVIKIVLEQNPDTKSWAIMMGTGEEVQIIMNKK